MDFLIYALKHNYLSDALGIDLFSVIIGWLGTLLYGYAKNKIAKPKLSVTSGLPTNTREPSTVGRQVIKFIIPIEINNHSSTPAYAVSIITTTIHPSLNQLKLFKQPISENKIFQYNTESEYKLELLAELSLNSKPDENNTKITNFIDSIPFICIEIEYYNESNSKFKTLFYPNEIDREKRIKYKRRIISNWWI
jgi:hypothetical protein